MLEVNKKPIAKNRSLFNGSPTRKRIFSKTYQKYSSVNNLSLIKGKNMKYSAPKKFLNVIDFISQKNKFYMEDSFDFRGTREFLASKEVAMREIKLNDEIFEEKSKKKKKECSQNNLLTLDFNYYQESDKRNNKSSKITGKYSISPRKSRKKSKKLSLNIKTTEIKKYKKRSSKGTKNGIPTPKSKNTNKNIKENSSYLGSNKEINNIIYNNNNANNSYIYKFFIDNANETEENFQKKLKKEIKKVESINKLNKKDNHQRRSLSKGDLKHKKPKRMNSVIIRKSNDSQSLFKFSEYSKNLMIIDDISISSIGYKKERDCNSSKKANKKKIKRKYGSIQMNNKQIKERIKQKIEKNDSDKDSIISILSELM